MLQIKEHIPERSRFRWGSTNLFTKAQFVHSSEMNLHDKPSPLAAKGALRPHHTQVQVSIWEARKEAAPHTGLRDPTGNICSQVENKTCMFETSSH